MKMTIDLKNKKESVEALINV